MWLSANLAFADLTCTDEVEIEEISYQRPRLCVGLSELRVLSLGLLFGDSNPEKWSDHQRKKFFINNSLKSIKA